jgi:hypothetical protein
MKKIFNVILLALFCTSFAQAQGDKTFEFTYEGQTLQYEVADGNEAMVSEQQSEKISGDVKIPESVTFAGEKYSVTTIGKKAFFYCDTLTSVSIPNSVTTIGTEAFGNCRGLTSITIPNSVKTIEASAFWGCEGLTNVFLPNSVETIEASAFGSCENLKSIDVAKDNSHYSSENGVLFDISKKTLIQYPCGIKGKYVIPNSVTTIGEGAFMYCGITDVTIPNNVKTIGAGAFGVCKGLTNVTIPSSVTMIEYRAFGFCVGLTVLAVENATPPEMKEDVFDYVSKNITIYVPAESVEKYKTAEGWSRYADKIKAIGK